MESDQKKDAKGIIRHYVIGGMPPSSTIEEKGGQVEVYEDVLRTIIGWSGLTVEEVEAAIEAAPDTIENSKDVPNYKPLYFEALKRIKKS